MSFLNKLKERSAAFSASRAEETHEQDRAAAHTLEGGSSAVPRDEPQSGILKAEAAKVAAGWWIYVAWVGIALVSYVYGLDNNTTYAYLQAAATHFGAFPLYSSMSVLQQVLIGVIKLPVAKLSDVIGRAEAYTISVLFYIIGFIVIATSQSVSNVFGGVVLQAIGNTGTQIMQQIVIADWVPADWRGFAIGLVSWPYIVNFAVAPRIVGALCPFATCSMSNGWRWGAGMFTIMLPVVSAPIIMVLALSQRRAQKQNLIKTTPITRKGLSTLFFKDFDIPGLVLIVAGWLLVLLPLQLHAYAPNNWQTPYIIAMFVVGGVCLIGTGIWEGFFSPRPIIRRTYIVNKNVLFPTIIGFFDFLSFYCSWLNAYMWVSITFDWTATQATYFSNTQSICLTVFGITAGFIALITKRYKWQMVIGACIRLLGLGLMIRYRTPDSTTGQIIMPQVLQGLGGGMLGVLLQVTAQVNVPHQDVAMVTAFVLLLTEIGGAVGSAITGAVQLHVLPNKLALYLPQLSATERAAIVAGSYSTYAYGTPERDGIIAAWSDFMHVSLIIATVTAVVPIILCLGLSDRRLTKKQNAIGDERKFSEDSTDTSVDGMEGSHGSDHKV